MITLVGVSIASCTTAEVKSIVNKTLPVVVTLLGIGASEAPSISLKPEIVETKVYSTQDEADLLPIKLVQLSDAVGDAPYPISQPTSMARVFLMRCRWSG